MIGRPLERRGERHPDDLVDKGREARIVAARRDDQRQNDALLRRRDAPAAGETGKIGLRARRGGRERIVAALGLGLEPGEPAAGEHRIDAMLASRRNGRPSRPVRPLGSPAPESWRRANRAGIRHARNRPSRRAPRPRPARRTAKPRSSPRRRRRRTETVAVRARWRRRRSRRRRPCSPPYSALARPPESSRRRRRSRPPSRPAADDSSRAFTASANSSKIGIDS